MMKFDYIRNDFISKETLIKICFLKIQHWNYDIEQQMLWINQNLNVDDIHLVLWEDDNLIGYLNIINLELIISNRKDNALGIGNVCIDRNQQKKYYGFLLMKLAEYYLKVNDKIGLLLCKKELVPFYRKIGWTEYVGEAYIENAIFNQYVFISEEIKWDCVYINRFF
jgi:predicted GNAT family N-acyltransferase